MNTICSIDVSQKSVRHNLAGAQQTALGMEILFKDAT